jgi:hypothetical protein
VIANFTAGYATSLPWRELQLSLRLNISNVFDNDDNMIVSPREDGTPYHGL